MLQVASIQMLLIHGLVEVGRDADVLLFAVHAKNGFPPMCRLS